MPDIHDRLYNWARWSRHQALPDLSCKPPPIFAQWIPKQAWDTGWGDQGAPEDLPDSINVHDAELIGYAVGRLNLADRTVVKRHYLCGERQDRLILDHIGRTLEDLMR